MTLMESPAPIPTRAGMVADRLRGLIQTGEVLPGSVLRQNEVAARFGVSTTPVREAFAILMRDGLVQQDAHRSVRVFSPSAAELAEIYEIRGLLEPGATTWATKLASEEDLSSLDGILEEMRTSGPGARYLELNVALHARIYAIANRPRLAEMIESLRKTSSAYLHMTLDEPDPVYAAKIHAEHEAIVEAMRAGDAERAATVTREHLETTRDRVIALLE